VIILFIFVHVSINPGGGTISRESATERGGCVGSTRQAPGYFHGSETCYPGRFFRFSSVHPGKYRDIPV
jgi:hypothetical protein